MTSLISETPIDELLIFIQVRVKFSKRIQNFKRVKM